MGGLFSHTVVPPPQKAQKQGRKPGWSSTLPNKEQMTKIMSYVVNEPWAGRSVGYMTTGVTQYELYKYQELAAKIRSYYKWTCATGVRPPTEGQLGVRCWPMPWCWMRPSWRHT